MVIYDLNVVKCFEMYYNNDESEILNYVRWGALIYCNSSLEVPSITKGIMTKEEWNLIMDKLNKLTKEDLFMTEEQAMHWYEWEKNTIYSDGVKEGLEQNTEKTIKAMLEKSFPLKDISEITGKSIEEIEEFKNK